MGWLDWAASLAQKGFGDPPAPPDCPSPLPSDPEPASGEQERLGAALTDGNALQLLLSGHEALPAMLSAIGSAEQHIHLQTMVFFDDHAGRLVEAALAAKASEGVRIRVAFEFLTTALGDPFFSKGISPLAVREMVSRMRAAGIEVRDGASFPLELMDRMELKMILDSLESIARTEQRSVPEWLVDDLRRAQRRFLDRARQVLDGAATRRAIEGYRKLIALLGPEAEKLLTPIRYLRQFLLHDHRKILVIDGRVGFCGGMNIGQEYLYAEPFDPRLPAKREVQRGGPEPWEKWRDVHLRVEGPAVNRLQRLFLARWLSGGGDAPPDDRDATLPPYFAVPDRPGRARVCVLDSAPGSESTIEQRVLAEIASSSASVKLSNPYLIRETTIGALLGQARNGVDVQLLLSDKHNDSFLHQWLMRGCCGWYQDAGAVVHEYQNHFTHAKVAVFDEARALVGSFNFNNRSALLDYECSLLIDDPQFASEVSRRVFQEPIDAGHSSVLERGIDKLTDIDRVLGSKQIIDLFPDVF